jgi:hypothetical protein
MENWLPVVGFEGYEISDLGNVRGKFGRILKPGANTDGYHFVGLYGDTKKQVLVHRLVAAAFLGPCPAGHEVDHHNDIRTDNRLANLKYLTHSENIRKQPKRAGCASDYIGVYKTGNRWQSHASRVYLGYFDTQEEAARARDKFYRDNGQLVTFNFEL